MARTRWSCTACSPPSAAERASSSTRWALAEELRAREPALFTALVEVPRRIPFYFGEVHGPTLAKRGGSLAFTHSLIAPTAPVYASDPVARRLERHLAGARLTELPLRAGDTLVVDNQRMLHGRRAFADPRRELARVLAWLPRPLGAYPDAALVARLPERAPPPSGHHARGRLAVVLAMVRGVPPGVLSARAGVREADLYAWRDAALGAALNAL